MKNKVYERMMNPKAGDSCYNIALGAQDQLRNDHNDKKKKKQIAESPYKILNDGRVNH